jgi:hypothetical protein
LSHPGTMELQAIGRSKWPSDVRVSQTRLICSPSQMEPARQTFDPAGAGALLVTGTAAGTAGGALIGWATGSLAYGLLAGAAVGVPLGIYAVYRRYGKSL